jgi:succinyl-CoA synthetase beta subunit
MYWGSQLLRYVEFPAADILGPEATRGQIQDLIDRHGEVLIKPIFRGGVGKKGRSGLIGRAKDVSTALAEKERLYFAEQRHGAAVAKAEGVTFEGFVESDYEVYFSITDNTRFRAPTVTLTHKGGADVEDRPRDTIMTTPFDPLTGFKAFVVSNTLRELEAPKEIISPLVRELPKLWDLYHNYGMTTLELNPIRLRREANGRLTPIACDFKCAFDIDDPAHKRLGLPANLDPATSTSFEREINGLRTYQGQSDVYVLNPKGTITPMTFGGGANALVTELLGDDANISTDFGGNPPYEKMLAISRIVYRYWLAQSNVLLIIGGKANNTDIFETFRAMGDALREHFEVQGPAPLYVVVGRGGPNLVRGLAYIRDVLEGLGVPYNIFGHDSAMSEVVRFAQQINSWMQQGGRQELTELQNGENGQRS